jgi:hypothetical protein
VYSCSLWLRSRNSPPSPRTWAHIRGCYWSYKIDDISVYCVTPCSSLSYRLSRILISKLRAYCLPPPPCCASAGAEIFRERAFPIAVSSLPTVLPFTRHSSEIKVLSISTQGMAFRNRGFSHSTIFAHLHRTLCQNRNSSEHFLSVDEPKLLKFLNRDIIEKQVKVNA